MIASAYSYIDARAVRSMLTEGEVPANDRRALFVGLEAYEQAGGAVRRDLFSDDAGGITLHDPALLDRLVMEKLNAAGDQLRAEGWHNVAVSVEAPEEIRAFYAAPCERIGLSEEAADRLTALGEELDSLAAQAESEGLADADEARSDAIQGEIEAIEARAYRYDDETKLTGTAFVHLDWQGMRVFCGLPRAGMPSRDAEADETGSDVDDGRGPARGTSTNSRPELSAALMVELHAQRTVALQAQVASRPGLALRLLAQSLMLGRGLGLHHGYGYGAAVAKIAGHGPYLKQACPTIEDTTAHRALTALHERRGDRAPGKDTDILPWLLSLTDGDVLDVLAPLVASTLDAGTGDWWRDIEEPCLAAQAARAAELDMTDYWTATPGTYLLRVSKTQIAQAVRESGAGPFSADGKKVDVAATATRLLAGTGWLPSPLRMPSPAGGDDATPHIANDDADALPMSAAD